LIGHTVCRVALSIVETAINCILRSLLLRELSWAFCGHPSRSSCSRCWSALRTSVSSFKLQVVRTTHPCNPLPLGMCTVCDATHARRELRRIRLQRNLGPNSWALHCAHYVTSQFTHPHIQTPSVPWSADDRRGAREQLWRSERDTTTRQHTDSSFCLEAIGSSSTS